MFEPGAIELELDSKLEQAVEDYRLNLLTDPDVLELPVREQRDMIRNRLLSEHQLRSRGVKLMKGSITRPGDKVLYVVPDVRDAVFKVYWRQPMTNAPGKRLTVSAFTKQVTSAGGTGIGSSVAHGSIGFSMGRFHLFAAAPQTDQYFEVSLNDPNAVTTTEFMFIATTSFR